MWPGAKQLVIMNNISYGQKKERRLFCHEPVRPHRCTAKLCWEVIWKSLSVSVKALINVPVM